MAGRSPARFLAPLALVAFAVALFVVISHGTGSGSGDSASPNRTASPASSSAKAGGHRRHHRRRTYTVKPGDTPSGIAAKTGISLERLQRLNPNLDPQSLSPGQKIKLRR